MIKLWLDDVRLPPDNTWKWVKNVNNAKILLATDEVDIASFDHDLGEITVTESGILVSGPWKCENNGSHLVDWMEETGHWPDEKPTVHSMNPVGKAYMERVIDKHWAELEEDYKYNDDWD